MNKEELLKANMKIPKEKPNIPITTMNSINVDDLTSAVDRLNEVPNYNDLLKENKQLKDNWNKLREVIRKKQAYYRYVKDNRYRKFLSELLDKMQELQGSDNDGSN